MGDLAVRFEDSIGILGCDLTECGRCSRDHPVVSHHLESSDVEGDGGDDVQTTNAKPFRAES